MSLWIGVTGINLGNTMEAMAALIELFKVIFLWGSGVRREHREELDIRK